MHEKYYVSIYRRKHTAIYFLATYRTYILFFSRSIDFVLALSLSPASEKCMWSLWMEEKESSSFDELGAVKLVFSFCLLHSRVSLLNSQLVRKSPSIARAECCLELFATFIVFPASFLNRWKPVHFSQRLNQPHITSSTVFSLFTNINTFTSQP